MKIFTVIAKYAPNETSPKIEYIGQGARIPNDICIHRSGRIFTAKKAITNKRAQNAQNAHSAVSAVFAVSAVSAFGQFFFIL